MKNLRYVLLGFGAIAAFMLAIAAIPLLTGPKLQLAILSGSENAALEPIIQDWADDNNAEITISYKGSVEISRELEKGSAAAPDAVWPANTLWIALGDRQKVVKHAASILRSPVVLGLKKPIAEKLGWVGRSDITIQMIAEAARAGSFRLAMTSATQSNSGASAYLGFLYALAGNPDILTLDTLRDEQLLDAVRDLLAQVDRSSGSSGWLAETVAANPAQYDAMVNYEAQVIEANQALTAKGEAPLYVIYPANGLSVADSPLGFIGKGDPAREETFLALQSHLLSREVQDRLFALGRRTGLIGLAASGADPEVWNPGWGLDLSRDIAPVPVPEAEVIAEALRLYQTELRKPSLTIWLLDVSGSMQGEPIAALQQAMVLLLDPASSAVNLLQPSRRDISIVIPFNHSPVTVWRATGNDPAELAGLLARVRGLEAGGGTDVYSALIEALEQLTDLDAAGELTGRLPAIVAMTDGASDEANRPAFLERLRLSKFGRDIPIHSIAFGEADVAQLEALSGASLGRLFKAGDDLAAALRNVKGYN